MKLYRKSRPELTIETLEIEIRESALEWDGSHASILARGIMEFVTSWGGSSDYQRMSIVKSIRAVADFIDKQTEA